MEGLSSLNFQRGVKFSVLISNRFGPSTSMTSSIPFYGFFLTASFTHSVICLNEDSISLLLQVVLGEVAKDFHVVHQSDQMFRFSVASKNIGFMVRHLSKFATIVATTLNLLAIKAYGIFYFYRTSLAFFCNW